MASIPEHLLGKLDKLAVRLRSLLAVLDAFRRSAGQSGENLKTNALYCRTLRSSGKLSCELTSRLDTLHEIVSEEEFSSLLARLGCSWDDTKSRASLK